MDEPIRTYFREVGRYPLLTPEQQISYAKQVQQMISLLSARKILARRLHREPTIREWATQAHLGESELDEIV